MPCRCLLLRSVCREQEETSRFVCSSCPKIALVSLLASLFVHAANASPLKIPRDDSSQCGRPINTMMSNGNRIVSKRIIGGQAAGRGAWPWMVAIKQDDQLECGGAIISSDLILTASHCFISQNPLDLSKWTVSAGKYNLGHPEPTQSINKIKKVITHEKYDPITVANDIALVVLEQPLTFSAAISPICLPPRDQGVTDGELCYHAGWGLGSADPNILNKVALPIISDSTCAQPDWYGSYFSEPNTTFCAGYADGRKDGCLGDSGGPLICSRGRSWYVQGISSWAFGCGQMNYPGIYTEVNEYATWITEHIALLRQGWGERTDFLG